MERQEMVSVWDLRLTLGRMVTQTELEDLEQVIKERAAREPLLPFLWQFKGIVVTIRTQGDVFLLTEVINWALMHLSHGPTEVHLESKNTAPLAVREGWGWSGHGRA